MYYSMSTIPRTPIWLPYLQSMEIIGKEQIRFVYNGGEVVTSPKQLTSVMLYGDAKPLDFQVIELLGRNGIPLIIHRRNLATTIWIHSGIRADKNDTLTAQIIHRQNDIKRKYITRRILQEKLGAMHWLIEIPDNVLKAGMSVAEMRQKEAYYSKVYWKSFFTELGVPEQNRRGENEIRQILDAVSKFCSGILLRWISYHHLSPFHRYCHEPTDYPALVNDILDPYGWN